jgi:hypothetical protein
MSTLLELMEADLDRRYPWIVAAREKHRAERLQEGDYGGYLFMFGGHKRFPALLEIEHLLPDKDYWKCLNLVWANIEISTPDRREWLRLFTSQRPHRELLMSKTERKRLAAMPDTLTIYRGYAKGRARSGLSWTLSEKRAHFFADYAAGNRRRILCGHTGGSSMVVCGKCHKHDVLAYFNNRKEQEIVIDGRKVLAKRSMAF